jgi:hypothetical protein
MMGYMSRTNLMVKEINKSPGVKFVVWAINGVKGSLDKVVIVFSEVWNVYISVLKPAPRIAPEHKMF